MHPEQSSLGQKTHYENQYNPTLLFPIERFAKRVEINLDVNTTPLFGYDLWTHYEVSWLNKKGKPQVAIAIMMIPCHSRFLIESKSLKLYFNSFNQTPFSDWRQVKQTIVKDLSQVVETEIQVHLYPLGEAPLSTCARFEGLCLDDLDISCHQYQPDSNLLNTTSKNTTEVIHSNLLKSNCLVTNQPDWGSVQISYQGPQIDHEGLLRYIISFREHNEFHEQCIERMFMDILRQCKPSKLTVIGRYTRRGGLDINPVRSTHPLDSVNLYLRLIRQ
ncbi:NADPH-dependent 7-cyano-7-deazaguanine reductase QueF [Legionella sp. W05-934-2]|jgi:7-cyano-7-deazaguanine reductase|uniref:NADPH-dependent 7-cyano-7-deazaguanine reductase QueF n=1 Tax=Legionella sp. W05-934-2 TaxID=1198649 RepID=UPI00346363C3